MAYETTDLGLAAALKCALHLAFPEVRPNGNLSRFIFNLDSQKLEETVATFYDDTLMVPARRYAQDLRDLKSLIFAARGGQGR